VTPYSARLKDSVRLGLNNRKAQRKIIAATAVYRAELNKVFRANVPTEKTRITKMAEIDERLEAIAQFSFVSVEPLSPVTKEK
jgi:hypothetical protein